MGDHLNKIFEQYKNKFSGETAVLIGGGPTIDHFVPIKEATIYVGVNFIGKHKLFNQELDNYIMLDYYFFGDSGRHMDKTFKVKGKKFAACIVNGAFHRKHVSLKEAEALGACGMEICNKRPLLDGQYLPKSFHNDIANNLVYGHTVVMAALQFLVYAGVSKIYLVGMDCEGTVCFNDIPIINSPGGYDGMTKDWDNAKKWLDEEHSEIEIISVNPRGLKGYFKDLFQND